MVLVRRRAGVEALSHARRAKLAPAAARVRSAERQTEVIANLAAAATVPPSLRQVASVNHQGTVIVFARDLASATLYYNILDLQVTNVVDNLEWTGFSKLAFPPDLRPEGLGIVTVGDADGTLLADASLPLQVVSDERYVCVFQQSSRGTLLLNRFMLKRVAPTTGGATIPALEPVWEVRFQRSGKQDVPDGPRDSQNYTSPDGTPFIEPTIELPMIRDVTDGQFAVLILPNESSSAKTWQFFTVNAHTKTLDLFAFAMDENGLFDVSDKPLGPDGDISPDVSVKLTLTAIDNPIPLEFAGAPTATLYTLRERVRTTPGTDLLLKRTARVLVAQPVKRQGAAQVEVAVLDFALGKNGQLAQIRPDTSVSIVSPANDALQFAATAYLGLPNAGPLALTGSFKADFWLLSTSTIDDDQYIFRGDPAVAANEAAPYVKVRRDLSVEIGFGTGGAAVAASTVSPVVTLNNWVHVTAIFDAEAASQNFQILINGNSVPINGANNKAKPAGKPITTINAKLHGLIGTLDQLQLWSGSGNALTQIGDWPLDQINYEVDPPTTPDTSPNHLDAAVHGAILVSSSAPISADDSGTLQIDPSGLSIYAGLLDFVQLGGSPYLLTGSDGLVHLYFAGESKDGRDGLYSVAQFDAESARAIFEDTWSAAAQRGAAAGYTSIRRGTLRKFHEYCASEGRSVGRGGSLRGALRRWTRAQRNLARRSA